jgi:intracellular septation protein A
MGGLGYALRYFASDLAPMILFLGIFLATGNIYLATGIGIGFGLVQPGWSLLRRTTIGALQWASLGLVVVFGTATLVTRDPRFIMFKPSWMERYTPEAVREAARPMLNLFGFIWAGLMFFTAALNLLLVFTVDAMTWARFNLFFSPVSVIALFAIQNVYMRVRAARAGYVIPG